MGAEAKSLLSRVGVIGDVHTELESLTAVLAFLVQRDLDRLLCTGDIADGPETGASVNRCCELLDRHGVITVCGNHDRWLQDAEMRELPDATLLDDLDPAARDFLAALPTSIDFDTPRGRALLCHGLGDDDMAGVQPHDHGHELATNEVLQGLIQAGCQLVISGHTHRRMVRRVENLTLINAGTLLRTRDPCFAIVDLAAGHVDFYDVDGESISEAEQHELP